MLVDQEKTKPPSEVLRHSVSNERVNARTSNKGVDVRTLSRGQLGLKNDDYCCLTSNDKKEQTRRAMVLVDQEKMKLPPEVPRHGTSKERVDIETSSERINMRMLSRGHLGLENNDDRCCPGKDISK